LYFSAKKKIIRGNAATNNTTNKGGKFHRGRTKEVETFQHVDEILRAVLLPLINEHTGVVFQKYNAHVAQISGTFLQQAEVEILPWPARSSDLNSIFPHGKTFSSTSKQSGGAASSHTTSLG
jgi:hypothetical protein